MSEDLVVRKVKIMTPRGPREVDAGAPFIETIKEVAAEVGLKSLRVFQGDVEIAMEDAPATLESDVVLYPYDVPA